MLLRVGDAPYTHTCSKIPRDLMSLRPRQEQKEPKLWHDHLLNQNPEAAIITIATVLSTSIINPFAVRRNITLCNAEPSFAAKRALLRLVRKISFSAEYALGSKLHTIFYSREERFSRHSGSVWYNISISGNIWGGNFYRTWTVKLMNCACASAGKVSFTVQVW